jgi:hypothetical protein
MRRLARLSGWVLAAITLVCGASAAVHTLSSVEAELNLERRSRFALELAHANVRPLVDAYIDGKPEKAHELRDEIAKAVDLAAKSLDATGKHARRNPKHFKHAEIQTRKLVARLKEAQRELNFDEQRDLEDLIADVEAANNKLLLAILSRKKK